MNNVNLLLQGDTKTIYQRMTLILILLNGVQIGQRLLTLHSAKLILILKQIQVHKMSKLIQAFVTNPNDKTRARLQAYLYKHQMAVCLASPEEKQILNANGFKG